MNLRLLILAGAIAFASAAHADNKTLDAAIGGGIGAAIGNELGGRDGAILGGAIGAAVGTSGGHDSQPVHTAPKEEVRYEIRSRKGEYPSSHCPPGLAKQGRC